MRHAGFSMVALLVVATAAAAEPPTRFDDPLLDRLTGRWSVERAIRGEVVGNTLEAAWVLDHRFLRLHDRDTAKPSRYEAMVYFGWNAAGPRYVVHWLDVFGGRSSETLGFGRAAGDSIVLDFAYPEGPFRNTYRWYPERGEWTSRSESRDSTGTWRPFATDRMRPAARRR